MNGQGQNVSYSFQGFSKKKKEHQEINTLSGVMFFIIFFLLSGLMSLVKERKRRKSERIYSLVPLRKRNERERERSIFSHELILKQSFLFSVCICAAFAANL